MNFGLIQAILLLIAAACLSGAIEIARADYNEQLRKGKRK